METVYRTIELGRAVGDSTFEASLSSDEPYQRHFGIEKLDHSPGAIDLTRAKDGLPFLFNHDTSAPIGMVQSVRTDGKRLRGLVTFFETDKGRESKMMVNQGLRSISIGYLIHSMQDIGESNGDKEYLVDRWEPFEASLVSVPADPTVGFGRSMNTKGNSMETQEALSRSQRRAAVQTTSKREQELEEIIGIGKAYKAMDLAADFVEQGRSVEEFKEALIERMSTKPSRLDAPLPKKSDDFSQFSITRAVQAYVSNDWSKAGFEAEVNREMAIKYGRSARSIYVPLEALVGTRVMTTSSVSALVPSQHVSFIDVMRTTSKVIDAGATLLSSLEGNVDIPRQTATSTPEWLAEDDALTGGDLSFDSLNLIPKTVGAMTSWSRKTLLQSIPGIEEISRRDLAEVLGRAIDQAAIHGAGASNEPSGIYTAGSVNSVAMGGVPTYAKLVDMVTEVAKDNALNGNLAFITTPGMAGKLTQTLVASSAGSDMVWSGPINDGKLIGYQAHATNQVLANLGGGGNEHGIVFGNWSDLIIGMWGNGIDLLIDPYTYADRGRVRLTAFADIDIGLRHPASFCKATGATIS